MTFVIRFAEFLLCRFQWISVYLFTEIKEFESKYWYKSTEVFCTGLLTVPSQIWTRMNKDFVYWWPPLQFPYKYTLPWYRQPLHFICSRCRQLCHFHKQLKCYVIGMNCLQLVFINNLSMLQNKMCLLNKLRPFLSEQFLGIMH